MIGHDRQVAVDKHKGMQAAHVKICAYPEDPNQPRPPHRIGYQMPADRFAAGRQMGKANRLSQSVGRDNQSALTVLYRAATLNTGYQLTRQTNQEQPDSENRYGAVTKAWICACHFYKCVGLSLIQRGVF